MNFAVIQTGGKQYIVKEGDVLNVEKIEGDFKANDEIVFDSVLLVGDDKATKIGAPNVSGAKVTALFQEQGKGKKVTVIHYKQKSRYFKKQGHRQPYTKVKISKVVGA